MLYWRGRRAVELDREEDDDSCGLYTERKEKAPR